MSKHRTRWTMALALVAGVALVGAAFGAPQQAQHHPAQAEESQGEAGQMATCPMAEQMMGTMHRHMAMMQRMMSHMHGEEGAGMMEGHGMMADPEEGASGMGEHPMMGGMMHGMMADPASIDDPDVAAERAERLDSMIERMRSHLTKLEERAAALHQRAEELRQDS